MQLLIDSFPLHSSQNTIHILTHAHLDHGGTRLPKTFPFLVHCSAITQHLMELTHPKVRFQSDLFNATWCVLEDSILVYCFNSGHCIGGIGIYCPDHSYLHFGDGRPSSRTLATVSQISKIFIEKGNALKVKCDSYVATMQRDMPECVDFPVNIPTLRDSKRMLQNLLLENQRQIIHVKVAHFGTLLCLPRKGFCYEWHGSTSTPAANLCYHAFLLFQFDTDTSKNKKNIIVSFGWDKDPPPLHHNIGLCIFLSSNWWIQQCETDLFRPKRDKDNQIRIYACAHASKQELLTAFDGLCSRKSRKERKNSLALVSET